MSHGPSAGASNGSSAGSGPASSTLLWGRVGGGRQRRASYRSLAGWQGSTSGRCPVTQSATQRATHPPSGQTMSQRSLGAQTMERHGSSAQTQGSQSRPPHGSGTQTPSTHE